MDNALAGGAERLDGKELALFHLGLVAPLDNRHALARVNLRVKGGISGYFPLQSEGRRTRVEFWFPDIPSTTNSNFFSFLASILGIASEWQAF